MNQPSFIVALLGADYCSIALSMNYYTIILIISPTFQFESYILVLALELKWQTSDLSDVAPQHKRDFYSFDRAVFMSFHPPGQQSNPFVSGIRLEERKFFRIDLSQVYFFYIEKFYIKHT